MLDHTSATHRRPASERRRAPRTLRVRLGAAAIALGVAGAACTTDDTASDSAGSDAAESANAVSDSTADDSGVADGGSVELTGSGGATASPDDAAASAGSAFFDSSIVHDIEIEFDDGDYDEMIAVYASSGEKEWIEATITIDGVTYENAGLRLKGNSSLFGLTSETAGDPEQLPWLIRLDKYVDDQMHEGIADIVIRSNSTETAMNEAVAAELLEVAGLASQQAVATAFTVNGGDTELRLAMEHPDEIWADDEFENADGLLYKADSEGDYSYRGDDPDAYDDVFDQKAGDDDLTPLIEFLDFINNADDATFAASLADHLDVDAFATYLAFQDLVGNFDDIDGPGNNSYLYVDPDTDVFTVVNWDLNLAFGTANVNGGGAGRGGAAPGGGFGGGAPGRGGELPTPPTGDLPVGDPPTGDLPTGDLPIGGPGGAGRGGAGRGPGGGNVLSERFLAIDEFAEMVADATVELQAIMYDSGVATEIVATWTEVLTEQASELVDASTIQSDADAILNSIPEM